MLVENELRKLKTFDSGYFFGKRHFEEDGPQNYLVFQPINRCSKVIAKIMFHHANLKYYLLKILHFLLTTSDNSSAPALSYYGTNTKAKFNGSCLKQSKPSYTHEKTVNIYIVYELGVLALPLMILR